jgi:hypothetical protein
MFNSISKQLNPYNNKNQYTVQPITYKSTQNSAVYYNKPLPIRFEYLQPIKSNISALPMTVEYNTMQRQRSKLSLLN